MPGQEKEYPARFNSTQTVPRLRGAVADPALIDRVSSNLAAARRQFAQKGFYDTSIAGLASDPGLSKQALLHHFGTKEKRYAQVLSEISGRYVARIFQVQLEISDPQQQPEDLTLDPLNQQSADHNGARVVMRELLDNQSRAEQVANWCLKP